MLAVWPVCCSSEMHQGHAARWVRKGTEYAWLGFFCCAVFFLQEHFVPDSPVLMNAHLGVTHPAPSPIQHWCCWKEKSGPLCTHPGVTVLIGVCVNELPLPAAIKVVEGATERALQVPAPPARLRLSPTANFRETQPKGNHKRKIYMFNHSRYRQRALLFSLWNLSWCMC